MSLKSCNPVTPSQRQLVRVDRSGLFRGASVKTLTEGQIATGGRNNSGRITVRFRGGGTPRSSGRSGYSANSAAVLAQRD